MNTVSVLCDYFANLLLPRNSGIIAVVPLREHKRAYHPRPNAVGFLAFLAQDQFLEININSEFIDLFVMYPRSIAIWRDGRWHRGTGTIEPLPTSPKVRAARLKELSTFRVDGELRYDVDGNAFRCEGIVHAKFDLCNPDSVRKVEFVVQTLISRVKYMVGKLRRHNVHRPLVTDNFHNLLDLAMTEYNEKVLAPMRHPERFND